MARIIEGKRRMVLLSVDDVISIVREYQQLSRIKINTQHLRELLKKSPFYLPEDL